MKQDELVYVIGHQHPDTDAIAGAIAYANLKREMGMNAIPCRLGDLQPETEYLLKKYGFETPKLLEDARKTLKEIKLDKAYYVTPSATIRETLKLMQELNQPFFGVCDDEKHLLGLVSKSDLVNVGLGSTSLGIELLKKTPVKNIARVIDGKLIYDDPLVKLNGKVSIIAITQSKLANYEIKERIVIAGDDPQAQKELILKGAGLLILVWTKEVSPEIIALAKEYHCPLILSGHGSMNTSRYLYFAPPVSLVMNQKLISFNHDELVEDAGKKMMNYRFRGFPVVDEENHLVGYVGRYHVMNYSNRKLILVDHNEFSQSVKAIEKAQILEVVDHHRINDFSTTQPLNFRGEVIGSSASLIYKIYKENEIAIPKNLAALMLGAVLSDTLMFASPTTTEQDKKIASALAKIAEVDIATFGKDMFAASADIEGKSVIELINRDVKLFHIHDIKLMVSQIIIPEIEMLTSRGEQIQKELDQFTIDNDLPLCVLAITGIIDKGSCFYASGEYASIMKDAFPNKEGENHSILEGVLSRKKQFIPMITSAIAKNL